MVYLSGDWLVECDVCGFKRYRSQCRKTWDNRIVCADTCWEPRHPQDYMVRAIPNPQSVPDARPRPPDVFGSGSSTDLSISTTTFANNLLNPWFEDGTSHWVAQNSAALSVSSTAPYWGTYCLKITENGAAKPKADQEVVSIPGQRIRFETYVKGGTQTTAYPFLYDASNSTTIIARLMTISTTTWTKVQFDIQVPSGCSRLVVALEQRATKDDGTYLYYDHCSLTTV